MVELSIAFLTSAHYWQIVHP